jgi:hypothetical protein
MNHLRGRPIAGPISGRQFAVLRETNLPGFFRLQGCPHGDLAGRDLAVFLEADSRAYFDTWGAQ